MTGPVGGDTRRPGLPARRNRVGSPNARPRRASSPLYFRLLVDVSTWLPWGVSKMKVAGYRVPGGFLDR